MDFNKAAELIKKSDRVALVLPDAPDFDCLVAVETLARTLISQNKFVGLLKESSFSAHPLSSLITHAHSLPILPKELIISLNTSVSPISQLRYEKSDEAIDIVLSPKTTSLNQDAVSFKEGRVRADVAILIGVQNIENHPHQDFFADTPLIYIDIADDNTEREGIRLIDPAKNTLSEIAYEFATSLGVDELDSAHATLLFAALAHATENFQHPLTSANAFSTASECVAFGADIKSAFSPTENSKTLDVFQFHGRAAVRSKFNQTEGILWSFLTPDDFEKTGKELKDASSVMDYLHKEAPARRATILLLQEKTDYPIRALLHAHSDTLEAIRLKEGGEYQSPHLSLPQEFASFKDAEDHIASLLEESL